jgi:hypothetical protein
MSRLSSQNKHSHNETYHVNATNIICHYHTIFSLSNGLYYIIIFIRYPHSYITLAELTGISGIGLETCILFAKEGANVLMADISAPALEIASAKLRQLVPSAHRVEIQVIRPATILLSH